VGLDADVEAIRRFSAEQYTGALESWQWVGIGAKVPMFTSPFGDVFFRSEDGYWLLDTLEGSLTRLWDSFDALKAELETRDGQDHYLCARFALAAERRGIVPSAEQVYEFKIAPVLGGAFDVDNVGVIDFVVGVNLAGQIHEQVRNLPPGTAITGITIN
jgi:hypothetical protein